MKTQLAKQKIDGVVDLADHLLHDHFIFISASEMRSHLKCSNEQIQKFIDEWEQLTLDRYMADGGTYRYRRYGQFDKASSSDELVLLPHQAYEQSKEVNYLNGDIARWFEPLTSSFVDSEVLQRTLLFLADLYDLTIGKPTDWNIRLHPYRIEATSQQLGQPTPEGLHRDGVTFIASMMIQRQNVTGGVTTLTDNLRRPITTIELDNTFDIILANDARTLHDVSSIRPVNQHETASRDVLVIAFTKKGGPL
ncbi:MAG: 2OG-Fe dioxygenase family protein [Reinekea sp.]